MIISASYKTDIPAFYTPWFVNRLAAGFCKMVNPYNQQVYDISLKKEDVQAFVFWSRNYQPFLDADVLENLEKPFVCHLSVLDYPRILDQSTISKEKAVAQLREISKRFGKKSAVWRYDPIVISADTPIDWHLNTFGEIVADLDGVVDEVMVSFVQFYRKTQRNLQAKEVRTLDPGPAEKQEILLKLHALAAQHGIQLTLCAQPDLLCGSIKPSACIDVTRLEEIAGHSLVVPKKPHRKECGCASSKDIGEYNTCPHGCLYCYAVEHRDLAKSRYQNHDPDSAFLFETEGVKARTESQGNLF
ncbi:DUF1848 domain-containing protein [Terasakiella sp. A23]|uniref:DUF1848 domain-containing protein n=1 Tax=Terasakiella sp. FCG-A23 TaxID=3080561 RepID=UPI0029552A65|nr:DUF1848 domain-containing protein [Terasakiella sp. A23]MDV7339825.1 DUF1848 domain-containing protein [Terasakiella sp. A23]